MPCFNELFIMLGFIVLVAVLYFFFRAVHYVVSGATGFFANDRSTRLSGRQRVRSQTTTMPYTDTSPNLYSSSPPQPSGFEMWRKHQAYNPISLEARNQAAWLKPLTNPPLRRGEQKEGSPNWNPVLMQRKDYTDKSSPSARFHQDWYEKRKELSQWSTPPKGQPITSPKPTPPQAVFGQWTVPFAPAPAYNIFGPQISMGVANPPPPKMESDEQKVLEGKPFTMMIGKHTFTRDSVPAENQGAEAAAAAHPETFGGFGGFSLFTPKTEPAGEKKGNKPAVSARKRARDTYRGMR
jgi:hypothetical protein